MSGKRAKSVWHEYCFGEGNGPLLGSPSSFPSQCLEIFSLQCCPSASFLFFLYLLSVWYTSEFSHSLYSFSQTEQKPQIPSVSLGSSYCMQRFCCVLHVGFCFRMENMGAFFKCWVGCFVYWKGLMVFWLIGLALWCAGECCPHTVVLVSVFCTPNEPGLEYKE